MQPWIGIHLQIYASFLLLIPLSAKRTKETDRGILDSLIVGINTLPMIPLQTLVTHHCTGGSIIRILTETNLLMRITGY